MTLNPNNNLYKMLSVVEIKLNIQSRSCCGLDFPLLELLEVSEYLQYSNMFSFILFAFLLFGAIFKLEINGLRTFYWPLT